MIDERNNNTKKKKTAEGIATDLITCGFALFVNEKPKQKSGFNAISSVFFLFFLLLLGVLACKVLTPPLKKKKVKERIEDQRWEK